MPPREAASIQIDRAMYDEIGLLRAQLNEARHACYKAEAERDAAIAQRDAALAWARLWKRAAMLERLGGDHHTWQWRRYQAMRLIDWFEKSKKTVIVRRALGLPDDTN